MVSGVSRAYSTSQFHLQGRREGLDPWNGGEGQRPNRRGSCRGKVGVMVDEMPPLSDADKSGHTLVRSLLATRTLTLTPTPTPTPTLNLTPTPTPTLNLTPPLDVAPFLTLALKP